MLRLTDKPFNPSLHHTNHLECVLHMDLKVVVSHGWRLDIRFNLTRWCSTDRWWSYSQRVRCGSIEQALEQCKALALHYEEEMVDYYAMADLRRAEAELYENIMKRLRPEPECFRIGF